MKVYIGSLQYSPIYKSHCCALGKQCEKYGYSVTYLLSRKYEWMLNEEIKSKTIFIGNSAGMTSAVIDGLNFKHRKKLKAVFSVLTSYMYGTPVISTNVGGLPEVIFHLKIDYLLDKDSKIEEWIEGINFIRSDLSGMSKNCRDYFVGNFSETNWSKYFGDIFSQK